ncbi:LmbU family transcriptional regulator [Actinosynnema sp. NPDC059335]|uniref:LmbU family transcriptional regulator n=1 Tax=Actinosynnema sp. NPDC059335 TaxID=3346804 RepID=UPI00366D16A1
MRNDTAIHGGHGPAAAPLTGLGSLREGGTPETYDQVLTTRIGLRIPGKLPYESWERAGRQIFRMTDSFAWCMGDWLVYGQAHYSDRYRRAVDVVGLDYQTLRNYASVARRVVMSRRRPGLSFHHHAEVASLPPAEQDFWLQRAEAGNWSRNQFRQHLRDARRAATGRSASSALLPRVPVTEDRMVRWRAAALRSSAGLESWILAVLDDAAERALGPDWAPQE